MGALLCFVGVALERDAGNVGVVVVVPYAGVDEAVNDRLHRGRRVRWVRPRGRRVADNGGDDARAKAAPCQAVDAGLTCRVGAQHLGSAHPRRPVEPLVRGEP